VAQIGLLFVAGFGSSLVLGTFVGSLADRLGRKANCLAFAVMYTCSCLLTHSTSIEWLFAGRILGGISTSILNTAFEAWMVSEHNRHKFNPEWIGSTFSVAIFGSGVSAILAGLVASPLVASYGVNAPFDLSAACLVAGGVLTAVTWSENYGSGDREASSDIMASMTKAWSVLRTNGKVAAIGITQSLFEAAMYIFVFFWTPALEKSNSTGNLPHGIVFSIFMVCVMIGSKLFESFVTMRALETWSYMVFATAGVALAVPVVVSNHWIQLAALCVFEACCGVYFPLIAVLRGKFIPEEVRATLMNFFRVGLNAIVLIVLGRADVLGTQSSFALCALFLGGAVLPQLSIRANTVTPGDGEDEAEA
jgi:MFS transporter, MFS domain-containing protein family, molybdate-anion transporter